MMRRILGMLTFSCMRITEMVESEGATKLPFWDRIRYKTHLAICKGCRSYEKQSDLISKALVRLMSSSPEDVTTMADSTKKDMLERIKKNE